MGTHVDRSNQYKHISITLICAFIFTGFGQIYLQQFRRGLVFSCIHISMTLAMLGYLFHPLMRLHSMVCVPIIIFVLYEIYVIADAYLLACKIKAQSRICGSRSFVKTLLGGITILFVMFVGNGHILVAQVIKSYVVPVPPEPSMSMHPTITRGDIFLVNKYVYRQGRPDYGDIVVFNFPRDPRKGFVKRIIAKENDLVEIKDGRVYVNHKLSSHAFVQGNIYFNQGEYGSVGQRIRIPSGSYYVLGDNSQVSKDSRHWGFIKDHHIIGQAYKIIHPFVRSALFM